MMAGDSMNKTDIGNRASFIVGAFIGALVFIAIYGVRILDVTYDDWLLTNWYDLAQHHLGWMLYRKSEWHFPLGLCDKSFYPHLISVIYTDSLPLISFIGKLFSPVLPEHFQFLGFYGLFCYAMQGGCAKLLLRRFFKNEVILNLAAVPFIFNIAFMQRMYYHTALASHYLILIAFILFLNRNRLDTEKKRIVSWCILGSFCVTLHFVIYAMVSVMVVFFALYDMLCRRKKGWEFVRGLCRYLIPYLAVTVFVFYVFGGFFGGISGDSYGLGIYSADLNALFNSQGYSAIVPKLPFRQGQDEGLAYMGIMTIILLVPGTVIFVKRFRAIGREGRILGFSLLLMGIVMTLIALSNVISFAGVRLFEIPLPGFIFRLWSIFRASGRFLWPVTYMVMLFVIYNVISVSDRVNKYLFYIVLTALSLLQIYEYKGFYIDNHTAFTKKVNIELPADEMENWDLTGIRHVQFMKPYQFSEWYYDDVRDTMAGYAALALRHDMTVSNYHFSRDNMEKITAGIDACYYQLLDGRARKDTMYVFEKQIYEELGLHDTFDLTDMTEVDTGSQIVLISSDHLRL